MEEGQAARDACCKHETVGDPEVVCSFGSPGKRSGSGYILPEEQGARTGETGHVSEHPGSDREVAWDVDRLTSSGHAFMLEHNLMPLGASLN